MRKIDKNALWISQILQTSAGKIYQYQIARGTKMNSSHATLAKQKFPELKARQSIILMPREENEADIPIGGTKFGGTPDLTMAEIELITKNPAIKQFVGQINFQDMKSCDPLGLLPADGTLVLFLTSGSGPRGRTEDVVTSFYFAKGTPLLRAELPPHIKTSQARVFSYEPWTTLPKFLPMEIMLADNSDDEEEDCVERYEAVYEEALRAFLDRFYPGKTKFDDETPQHQMLGYNTDIQGMGAKEGEQWQLLLQVDSDERSGMRWYDAGQLYFWISTEDLQRRDFSKISLETASY